MSGIYCQLGDYISPTTDSLTFAKRVGFGDSSKSGDFVGMYPDPNVGPFFGKSLYRPDMKWVFMGL